MTPTYEQQWQKITSAYLNNTLNPWKNCACFIGNLLNGNSNWSMARHLTDDNTCIPEKDTWLGIGLKTINEQSNGYYSIIDICALEQNFLKIIKDTDFSEETLFEAMTSTLEVLRQIHEAKGDPTAKEIKLEKRVLTA